MEDIEIKSIIESILFMSGEPVTLDELRKLIEVDKYNTERLVRELIDEYAIRNSGIIIVDIAGGYQMATNPVNAQWIQKLLTTAVPKKLSQSSLETMAIVAYKQPITKAEIESIRGLNSDGVVKTLLERKLIRILGRKEAPGRPLMYGTTSEFLQYFGLQDLSELPTLKEFEEVDIPEPPENAPDDSGAVDDTSVEQDNEPTAAETGLDEHEIDDSDESGDNGESTADSATDNISESPDENHAGDPEKEQSEGHTPITE